MTSSQWYDPTTSVQVMVTKWSESRVERAFVQLNHCDVIKFAPAKTDVFGKTCLGLTCPPLAMESETATNDTYIDSILGPRYK